MKEEILKTAYRLTRMNGFDSFSYNDLSKAVGITKASIHYHFPSKEELGLAVCDLISRQLQWLQKAIADKPTAQEKLELYVQTICSQVEEGLICPISSLQAEYNVVPESMQQRIRELTAMELEAVTGILQSGLDEGSFDFEGDTFAQAALLVTSVKSATLYSRALGQDLTTRIVDQFIDQLKSRG